MGIDFKRRLRFLMPCKILNGLYIDTPQKQVGDVGMSQNVGRYIEVEAVGVSATLCLCSQFGFHLERRLFPIGITVVYPLFSSPPFDISPHKIAQVNADAYIRELVDLSKVDLTMYGAKASN